MTHPQIPRWHLIRRRIRETADTFSLELATLNRAEPAGFAPGQFNMIYMIGTGEVPISISGDPGDRSIVVHTIRAYGSVTSRMQTLEKGDIVGTSCCAPAASAWHRSDR